jgi:hypothetical protein
MENNSIATATAASAPEHIDVPCSDAIKYCERPLAGYDCDDCRHSGPGWWCNRPGMYNYMLEQRAAERLETALATGQPLITFCPDCGGNWDYSPNMRVCADCGYAEAL